MGCPAFPSSRTLLLISVLIDSSTSPCIDKGDPTSSYSNEPSPNGGRINMGAYGNTAQASKTDTVPPTADVVDVTHDPRTTAVDAITIVFSEAITGFDPDDLTLTREGGGNLLTAAQTLTSSDNVTWELGNLSDLTRTAGTYVLALSAAGSGITDLSVNPLADDASDAWVTTHNTIHIFYNHSVWDGNNAAANAADDGAIATEKSVLMPGQKATFANYTNFDEGINGLMIDALNLVGTPTASDFLFRVGNDDKPYGTDLDNPADDWPFATSPTSITVRTGAGVDGSDRVTLIWTEGAIRNC